MSPKPISLQFSDAVCALTEQVNHAISDAAVEAASEAWSAKRFYHSRESIIPSAFAESASSKAVKKLWDVPHDIVNHYSAALGKIDDLKDALKEKNKTILIHTEQLNKYKDIVDDHVERLTAANDTIANLNAHNSKLAKELGAVYEHLRGLTNRAVLIQKVAVDTFVKATRPMASLDGMVAGLIGILKGFESSESAAKTYQRNCDDSLTLFAELIVLGATLPNATMTWYSTVFQTSKARLKWDREVELLLSIHAKLSSKKSILAERKVPIPVHAQNVFLHLITGFKTDTMDKFVIAYSLSIAGAILTNPKIDNIELEKFPQIMEYLYKWSVTLESVTGPELQSIIEYLQNHHGVQALSSGH